MPRYYTRPSYRSIRHIVNAMARPFPWDEPVEARTCPICECAPCESPSECRHMARRDVDFELAGDR